MTFETFLLGLMIYREAAREPYPGQVAVGHVALTRAKNPRWWGSDLYSVITKPMQFSSMTDPKDPQTGKFPRLTDPAFRVCLDIATGIIDERIPNPVPRADSYFADYIQAPIWATSSAFLQQIGHHRFYAVEGVAA